MIDVGVGERNGLDAEAQLRHERNQVGDLVAWIDQDGVPRPFARQQVAVLEEWADGPGLEDHAVSQSLSE